tara:strand:+ start:810 stop:956 length:147 start_codon:yes stop_codon:yes gene_type:complete
MSQLFPEDIDELNAELRRLLDAELSAGNVVVETWRGWIPLLSIRKQLR